MAKAKNETQQDRGSVLDEPRRTDPPVPEPPNRYWTVFEQVVDNGDWGNWYTVGEYAGDRTARRVRRQIIDGVLEVPDVDNFDIDYEVMADGGSELKVAYMKGLR